MEAVSPSALRTGDGAMGSCQGFFQCSCVHAAAYSGHVNHDIFWTNLIPHKASWGGYAVAKGRFGEVVSGIMMRAR